MCIFSFSMSLVTFVASLPPSFFYLVNTGIFFPYMCNMLNSQFSNAIKFKMRPARRSRSNEINKSKHDMIHFCFRRVHLVLMVVITSEILLVTLRR